MVTDVIIVSDGYAEEIDALGIRRRLGRKEWRPPQPFHDSGWFYQSREPGRTIIVSSGVYTDNHKWVHASIAHTDRSIPSYLELAALHAAVWPDGHAYQVFVPQVEHLNIHPGALHLWGLADGSRVLPNFGAKGSI